MLEDQVKLEAREYFKRKKSMRKYRRSFVKRMTESVFEKVLELHRPIWSIETLEAWALNDPV